MRKNNCFIRAMAAHERTSVAARLDFRLRLLEQIVGKELTEEHKFTIVNKV